MPCGQVHKVPFYAVIDTNVLVSAFLKADSVPRTVIDYMYAGEIIPVYNHEIISEYRAVLHRPKFCFPEKAVDIAVNKIIEIGLHVNAGIITESIPDPKDIVFYAVTINAGKDAEVYLVTGNIKHFPQKPFVITPHQMLDILETAD